MGSKRLSKIDDLSTAKLGHLGELMAAELLTKNGFDVFHPLQNNGPVDIIALRDSDVMLLDIKVDRKRLSPNRITPTRIHRMRTDRQKELGVWLGYMNLEIRELHITDHDAESQDATPLVFR